MSSIAMAADSTQTDHTRHDKSKSCSRKSNVKECYKIASRADKSAYRKSKREQRSPSSSSSDDYSSLSESSHGQTRHSKRKQRTVKHESCSDCESDLDLSKELLPIGGYVASAEKMVEHMFRSISTKKLKAMLPEILKAYELPELKRLCMEELEGMSVKRIRRILDGDEPDIISSSESEHCESNLISAYKDGVTSVVNSTPCEVKTLDVYERSTSRSHSDTKLHHSGSARLGHEKSNEHSSSVCSVKPSLGPKQTSAGGFDKAARKFPASSASSPEGTKSVQEKALDKAVKVSAVANTVKSEVRELGDLENTADDGFSEHSYSSIPSLASEPLDTCQPFKFLVAANQVVDELIVRKKVKQVDCMSDAAVSSDASRKQPVNTEKPTCLDEGQSDLSASATAESKDESTSLVAVTRTMTATHSRSEDAIIECSRANAENDNNLNMEVENGRYSAGVAQGGSGSISAGAVSSSAGRSQSSHVGHKVASPVARLSHQSTASTKPVSSGCEDEVILDVQLHDFSDEEFASTSAPVAGQSSPNNLIGNSFENCSRLDDTESKRCKTSAPVQYSRRSDESSSRAENKSRGSSDDSSRLQKDRNRNERRRSADDARSVIVAKIQRRSHPPDSTADVRSSERRVSSRSNDDDIDVKLIVRPRCVETNKMPGTSFDSEHTSGVDAPKETPDDESKHEISSVRKIKITRPVPRTECNAMTKDVPLVKTNSANRDDTSDGTGVSSVREKPERKKPKPATSSGRSEKSNAQLSPEALSKTELEILELEMRARAIKAMLRAQEELERSDLTSVSRHGQQQDRTKQHGERVRAEPPRRRVAEQSRVAVTTRRVLTAPVRRSALPSPPPSRHRVIHRNAITEIIARRRQRQLTMRDRLARFGHQPPPPSSSSRTDARLKLNAAYVGRRVMHKPVHRSGSRVVTLSSNYVSRSSVVTPPTAAPPPPSSSDLHRRRRSSGGNSKQMTTVDKSSGSNRGDVRRVCVTAPRRLVRVTSDRSSAPMANSKTQVQTARKNR